MPTTSDNGLTGTWNPAIVNTSELGTKVYTFTPSPEQCASDTKISISILQSAPIKLGDDTSLCTGESLLLNAGSGFTDYKWSTGDNTQDIILSKKGTYSVVAIGQNGCSSYDTIIVSYKSKPEFDLGKDFSLCEGSSFVLSPKINTAVNYLWGDGTTKSELTVEQEGIYSLTATNECGSMNDVIHIGSRLCDTLFPSAFTPNEDGRNDFFRPTNAYSIDSFRLVIYNRFGQKIFESIYPEYGWDGSVHGKPQGSGTYVWFCTFRQNKDKKLQKGTVVLIR